jgi:hypothetical protein
MDDSNDGREPELFSMPSPALLIAYLSYAVPDVSALSARSTSFLESAIEALREETASCAGTTEAKH